MKRREFLRKLLFGGAATLGAGCAHIPWLRGAKAEDILVHGEVIPGDQGMAIMSVWRGRALLRIPVPVSAHSILQHPRRPNSLILIPQERGLVCEIDFKSQSVLHELSLSSTDRYFGGHGVFSADGARLYMSEIGKTGSRGGIGVWDTEEMKRIGEFSSHGHAPHEIALLNDDKILVVANGGRENAPSEAKNLESSLDYIEVASGKLQERIKAGDPYRGFQSLQPLSDGGVLVGMSFRSQVGKKQKNKLATDASLAVLHRLGGKIENLPMPENPVLKAARSTFGVGVDDAGVLGGISYPESDHVVFWNLKERRLLKAIRVTGPRGIAYDKGERRFVISTQQGPLYAVNAETLELSMITSRMAGPHKVDSHLTFFSLQ